MDRPGGTVPVILCGGRRRAGHSTSVRYAAGEAAMSFELEYYYLIEPTPRLAEQVRRQLGGSDLAEVLLERLLIPKMHVRGHGYDEANEAQLKLAYLSMLRVDRVWDHPEQFEALFGSSQLSVELFDRWWTLSDLDAERFVELEDFVARAASLMAPQTDARVVAWLEGLTKPK
jgi:hypothetical protein